MYEAIRPAPVEKVKIERLGFKENNSPQQTLLTMSTYIGLIDIAASMGAAAAEMIIDRGDNLLFDAIIALTFVLGLTNLLEDNPKP